MNTFSVKFKVGHLELDAIVTPFDHHQKFKVEMVTNEPDPIILARSEQNKWAVESQGQRSISVEGFRELEKAIDAHLGEIYGAKNILVLTDFSDAAFNAASYAAALTHQLKTANIVLYHSLAMPVATDIPVPVSRTAALHQERAEQIKKLKDQLQPLVSDQTDIAIVSDERPLSLAVNTLAEQRHIGLVVMGITGKSNLEKILVGSNTIMLAKDSLVPLLIVPQEAVYVPIEKIVFACDLKKVSKTTPASAIQAFIHALKAKLYILNVGDHIDSDTKAELAALHRLWDAQHPEYHYIDDEDIATGIMHFVDEHQIQLVITVPKEYGFFESIFHRSVTKKLAYHTHLPLLSFKEDV